MDNLKEDWYGEHKEAQSEPLLNKPEGKPIILRMFEFVLPPGDVIPSNEFLANVHKANITELLWKDELVLIQDLKVVKSKDNHHFRIFATCQPRTGSVILDKPKLIQDLLNAKQPI